MVIVKLIMKCFYQDIEAPKFTTCPGIIFGYTNRNSLKGQAEWLIPTATDNHDYITNTSWSGSLYPNKILEPGTYTVTYTTQDSAGNKALPCVTKVVIKGKTVTIIISSVIKEYIFLLTGLICEFRISNNNKVF